MVAEIKYVEEAEYLVTVTLTTVIGFSPIPRDSSITKFDAIANGLGTVPDSVWEALEGEGWSIETDASRFEPTRETCPVCGQADNCGDCTHETA